MSLINNLDLNLLRSLKVLLEEKHVSNAAIRQHVSQPSMSVALRKLRECFSDPLLVRVGNTMELTAKALQLQVSLVAIFEELEIVETQVDFQPSKMSEVFRIHTTEYSLRAFLAKALQRLQSSAPELRFELLTISPASYCELLDGAANMIVGLHERAHPRFRRRALLDEPQYCLLEKDHPAHKNWCADEVFKYPQFRVIYPGYIKSNSLDDYANQHGLKRDVRISSNYFMMQIPCIAGSEIIAFIPKSLAEHSASHTSLVAKPPPMRLPNFKTSMMWNEISQTDPAHRWVRQVILEASGRQ